MVKCKYSYVFTNIKLIFCYLTNSDFFYLLMASQKALSDWLKFYPYSVRRFEEFYST